MSVMIVAVEHADRHPHPLLIQHRVQPAADLPSQKRKRPTKRSLRRGLPASSASMPVLWLSFSCVLSHPSF